MNLDWAKTRLLALLFCIAAPLCADDAKGDVSAAPEAGYTINYNTVSILEYIRFASKICNVNFIYNEADLNFNVSVVSDAPITPQNVMATLVQVLRINGLMLLEQDNNLVIHKSQEVNQIATIVTDGKETGKAPIVTRIFRTKNAKPDSLAAIIRPMISSGSLLEISPETRQLILTDVTANVEKVASLIEIIDSPHTPLDIQSYEVINNKPEFLIDIASQIMTPIAQGNPFLLVPQPLANSVFIVSTPELVDKAISMLKTLDTPPKKELLTQRKLSSENIFVYKAVNRSGKDVLDGLNEIGDNLSQSGIPEGDLLDTIHTARYVPQTNSIMFFGSPTSIAKVKEFLATVDTPTEHAPVVKTSFFVFKPQHRGAKEIEQSILEMADNLKGTKGADENLIEAIQSVKINPSTNTLVFSGAEKTFPQIKDLLTTMDTPTGKAPPKVAAKNNFFIYKIEHAPAPAIESSLKNFASSLDKSNASDEGLIESINNMKYMEETNSILFTGPDASLKRLQDILPSFDQGIGATPVSNQFFIYKPKYQKGDQLANSVKEVADSLKSDRFADPAFVQTLQSMKWVKANNSLLFTGDSESIKKLSDLISTLDVPVAQKPVAPEKTFFLYKPQYASREKTEAYLKQISDNLNRKNDEDLIDTIRSMKWIEPSQSFMFHGSEASTARVKELLQNFDTQSAAPQAPAQRGFYLYRLQNVSQQQMEEYLTQVADNLSKKGGDEDLVQTIRSMKWIEPSHSYMFNGSEASLSQLKEMIQGFDTASSAQRVVPKGFYLYHLQFVTQAQMQEYLTQVSDNLLKKGGNEDLVQTIKSMKWIAPSHSYMFQGSDPSITQLKELLQSFDTQAAAQRSVQKGFYLYHPQYVSQEQMKEYLGQVADNLSKKGGDEELVQTIRSMKWIEPSRSYMFNGSDASLAHLKDILQSFDTASSAQRVVPKGFYLYHLQYVTQDQMKEYLGQVSDNLSKKGGDEDLVATIKSMKWVEPSHSYMFQGSDASIGRLKELLQSFDTPEEKRIPKTKAGYYIYKLQNTSGDVVEEDLDSLAKNFKASGMKDNKLVDVIDNVRYVKETNSLLLTGDPGAIEEAKKLIAEYDYARAPAPKGPVNSNFFMYKPQNVPANQIQKSLHDIAANLKRADLADPALLSAIDSSKYVDTTNSLIFTGSPDALQKVQTLIKDIDIAPQKHAPIQHIGKTTFLLYKLKNASGPQILTSIKAMTSDLKKSGTSDKDFIAALQSVKYVKETNSLLFTGNEEALGKVEAFVEKFDVTSLAAPAPKVEVALPAGPSNFFVYKPVSLSGPDLEKIMQDFAENLRLGGLSDPDLFNAINSMRWVEKTQSLVFTGNTKALDQIKQLLTSFDIPSNLPEGPVPGGPLEPSIQAIDNTSFLVYKLQFHKGDEIQGALRQIAKDLIISNAPVNQNLLNSINSIQWLEVTNSLLCSGDQETLTRLRELIKNLDIPLKQVFIEMLVIETNLTNALQFGLEWGGKYKYRNKFQGSINNTLPQTTGSQGCTTDQTMTTLNNLVPANPAPTITSSIPFGCGFDLGVIGQVIKHNGNTFLTLGSLLTAVQTDDESSVILTPKIITQDGRTTNLFVGQNIPFVGSFVNNQGSTTVQTSNLEYRDIGLNLTITPVLGNSDIVTLDISLDRTQTLGDVTGGSLDFSNTSAQGITTSRTTMQTTVHVPDKNFLILSGFVNNSNVKSKAGIPCLGGLPIVGAAFSKDNDTVSNTNIVIFLRPHIINSIDDMRRVTADQEEAFLDQQGTPFLMKQFNEGMELIKSVDDD